MSKVIKISDYKKNKEIKCKPLKDYKDLFLPQKWIITKSFIITH